MTTTALTTTVLPYSVDPAAPFHLSLYLTHRLTGSAALADYPAMLNWVRSLRGATFALHTDNSATPIPCTALLSAADENAWATVFPAGQGAAGTEVREFVEPNVTGPAWISYPASRIPDHALDAHQASLISSPVARPRVTASPLAGAVLKEFSGAGGGDGGGDVGRLIAALQGYRVHRDAYLDAVAQANAANNQAAVGPRTMPTPGQPTQPDKPKIAITPPAGTPPAGTPPATTVIQPTTPIRLLSDHSDADAKVTAHLAGLATGATAGAGPAAPMLRDTHLAHSYYLRPEEQRPEPIPPAPLPPLPATPAPDFHERVSAAGGIPALLRALGLVVDIRVPADGLAQLANATSIWCNVTVADTTTYAAPKTACAVSGNRFVAVTNDPGHWNTGYLRVGDDSRYAVLDLDPDSVGLSLEQFLRGTIRATAVAANGDQDSFSPAALRSTGFAVAEIDRPTRLRSQLQAAQDTGTTVSSGGSLTAPFHYEDLQRGFRVWVWDDATGAWHNLHQRSVSAAFGNQPVLTGVPDTGILSHPPMNRVPGDDTNPYYVHEALAGWDGWSLSAPRPWLPVSEPGAPAPAAADPAPAGLTVSSTVMAGSLPALRYGRRYAFRISGVDLAGNSVAPDPTAAAPTGAALSAAGTQLAALAAAATARDAHSLTALCRAGGTLLPAGTAGGRRGDIEAAMASVIAHTDIVRRHPHLDLTPAQLAGLAAVGDDAATVSAPRPFLRWSPIAAPALVARKALVTGESLQRMVIRTGLTGPAGDAQRHLVPPKGSQLEAEQDGRFDALMAAGNAARAYATALKERGSLFAQAIQDLDNPAATLPQPGMALLSGPNVVDPVTLADIQDPNVAPKAGQYIVHDVDDLVLPYLPDPFAAGITLIFYESGTEHLLAEPRVLQSVSIDYTGAWPQLQPLRLVLHGADALVAHQVGNTIDVGIPPGRQVGVKLSSTLDAEHLAAMGLWVINPVNDPAAPAADRTVLADAACDGWLWWLTPDVDLRLVHASARPAVAPQLSRLSATPRSVGVAAVRLDGVLDVDGPSTDKVELRATWTNTVDDPKAPAPGTQAVSEVVTDYPIAAAERYSLLTLERITRPPSSPSGPDDVNYVGTVGSRSVETPIRGALHKLPDTRARVVSYRLFGSSRYREFFTAAELPSGTDADSMGAIVAVNIPSSAAPAIPAVTDVLPMFAWETETEPDQPFAQQRRRRSGVRIWLDRPWFSSGDDEMLAVITVGSADLVADRVDHISLWARDPVVDGPALPNTYEVPVLTAWQQRAVQLGLAPESLPGRPSVYVVQQGPANVTSFPDAVVAAYCYRPEFHPERRQWFVDVLLESAGISWPFLRLAVARYQPNSIAGQEFSPVIGTDFVQLPPERVATANRRDDETVQITLTGVTSVTPGEVPPVAGDPAAQLTASHRVVATVQTFPAGATSDLAWVDGAVVEATLSGFNAATYEATWTATVPLAGSPLQTPGSATTVRVQLEEYEILTADPVPGQSVLTPAPRLVYVDHFSL